MTEFFIKDLRGLYKKYKQSNSWKSALVCAQCLIDMAPDDPAYYRMAGRACAWIGDYDSASDYYKEFLLRIHGCSIPELVDKIRQALPIDLNDVKSTYEYKGGKNSFGSILHRINGDIVFYTKIQMSSENSSKELFFYKNKQKLLTNQFHSPDLIGEIAIDRIDYITISFLKGTYPSSGDVFDIVQTAVDIASAGDSWRHVVHGKDYLLKIKPRSIGSVIKFFSCIDQEKSNQSLIEDLRTYLERTTHALDGERIVDRLAAIVQGKMAYQLVDVSRHFSVVHGDFFSENILIDRASGEIKIIDWTNLMFGLKSIDIAAYLCQSRLNFSEIKRIALLGFPGFFETPVDRVFFVYMVIAMNICLLRTSDAHYQYNSRIVNDVLLPAIDYFEQEFNLIAS